MVAQSKNSPIKTGFLGSDRVAVWKNLVSEILNWVGAIGLNLL